MMSPSIQGQEDKWAEWSKLSPYAQQQIDSHETSQGRTLHAGSSAEQIHAAIQRYHRTSW